MLVLWSVSPVGGLVVELLPERETSTLVSESAITLSGQETKTCHHHPEGCPADCFCPNTSAGKASPDEVSAPGALSGPTLTQCTEESAKRSVTFMAHLFPFPEVDHVLWESASSLIPAAARAPVDRSPDLPQKIPIA